MADNPVTPIALKFYQFHRCEWRGYETVDEAIEAAYWMDESGDGCPLEVVFLDGRVLLDERALDKSIDAYRAAKSRPAPMNAPKMASGNDKPACDLLAKFLGGMVTDPDWDGLPDRVKQIWRDKVGAE